MVFYTSDCDVTRQTLFIRGCPDLGTAPPTEGGWIPDSTTWATDTVMISAVPPMEPVRFGFEFPTAGGRSFYLDNVRLEFLQPMSIPEAGPEGFTIAPNPATHQLRIRASGPLRGVLAVRDADGRCVLRHPVSGVQADIDLGGLANGLYLVHLEGTRNMARFAVAR